MQEACRFGIIYASMQPAERDQALDAIRRFHADHGRLPRRQE